MLPPLVEIPSDAALPARVDVAVIGGGIAGVAAAYYLAKTGLSIALLEKGRIGGEQSSRNWGWCRQQNRDRHELPLMQLSMRLWEGLDREIGADLGFRRTGLVYVTKSKTELAGWAAWVAMAAEFQVGSRILSPAEARAMTPGNEQDWIGGVHSPRDGRAEPALAAPAIAAAARRLGATIHQDCAVRGLDVTGGRVGGVITERGRIAAAAVLCAGGAWASMFCRRHGIDLPQAGVRSTIFITEPAPEVTPGGLVTPEITLGRRLDGGYTVAALNRGRLEITPQGLRYARQFRPIFQTRRASLTIGIGRSFVAGPEAIHGRWSFSAPSPFERHRRFAPPPDMRVVEPALRLLRATYPVLKGITVARAWGGWIDSTPDAIPVISPVERLPGFFLATGFSGHGFGIGPAAGRLAADLIAGNAPVVDAGPFRHARLIDGSDLGRPGMM
jgi:glycine/D-amino acid oxidase-like deaminating enzyme